MTNAWEKTGRDAAHEDIAGGAEPCTTLDEARRRIGQWLRSQTPAVAAADAEACAAAYLRAWEAHARDTSPAGLDLDAIEARASAASEGPWRMHSWEDSDGAGHITIETARVGGLGDMIADVQVSRLPEIRRAEEGAPDAPLPPRLAAGIARIDRGDDCIEHELTVDMLVSDATFITHARQDVPALAAELRRLRGLLDAAAQAFDDLVAQVWRATGETHEPPADVAALLRRVAEDHKALVGFRRAMLDACEALDGVRPEPDFDMPAELGSYACDEVARLQESRDALRAEVRQLRAAALHRRREGAEAMREACIAEAQRARRGDITPAEWAAIYARAESATPGSDSTSEARYLYLAEARPAAAGAELAAILMRALPLPGGAS